MTDNYFNTQDLDVSEDMPEVNEEAEMAALGITIKDPEEIALGVDNAENELDEVPLTLGNYDEDEE